MAVEGELRTKPEQHASTHVLYYATSLVIGRGEKSVPTCQYGLRCAECGRSAYSVGSESLLRRDAPTQLGDRSKFNTAREWLLVGVFALVEIPRMNPYKIISVGIDPRACVTHVCNPFSRFGHTMFVELNGNECLCRSVTVESSRTLGI